MKDIKIKEISAEETLCLRQSVLRRDLLQSECVFDEDSLESCFHLGAFLANETVGIASFFEQKDKYFSNKKCYRLRGMASHPNTRGMGVGRSLLVYSFDELIHRKADILWCNAREVAFDFYTKLGFQFYSEKFDIPKVGPHKKMYKKL